MRRGFTLLELLVASILLGVLTTILTMIFNQSSIAWRTGSAMVADLDDVRDNIAVLRDESDNAFVWDGSVYRLIGLWNISGDLNDRACDADGSTAAGDTRNRVNALRSKIDTGSSASPWSAKNVTGVGKGNSSGNSAKTYTVNVMSAGPDREFDTWDDIWSFPDDFD